MCVGGQGCVLEKLRLEEGDRAESSGCDSTARSQDSAYSLHVRQEGGAEFFEDSILPICTVG